MSYPKDKDYTQVIKQSFDDETGRLQVDSLITDGVDALIVNPDGSINVKVTQAANVTIGEVVESGVPATVYNEITSVASATLSTVASYTCTQQSRLKTIGVSGTNLGEFTVFINGVIVSKKRTSYFNFNTDFMFSKGLNLILGDVVAVKVIHNSSSVGDFNASLLVMQDDVAL